MTPAQMSFREYLTPNEVERAHALSAEILKRVGFGEVPTVEELAAATEAFAVIAAAAGANRVIQWLPLKYLLADMRKHIWAHMPAGPKAKATADEEPDRLTVNEVNVLRALKKYPAGVTLVVIEHETHIERRCINDGTKSAVRKGLIAHEAVKQNVHFYKLTPAGREAIDAFDKAQRELRARGGGPLLANPLLRADRKPQAPSPHQRARHNFK